MTDHIPVDAETQRLLQRYGFEPALFRELQERLRSGRAGEESNRIQGTVEPPTIGDVLALPPMGSDARKILADRGRKAIAAGEVAALVLAGGMATRFGGVVKAGVEVLNGRSFLDIKVRDVRHASEEAGGRVPILLMTSFATHDEVEELGRKLSTERCPVTCFPQLISLRLTTSGDVLLDDEGHPSPYAPGHGDVPFALRKSGVLERFLSEGGRVLYLSNVDNLTATLDPAVIGSHLESGMDVTVEVAPKEPGDKGGAPARVDGRAQIVESFRFPADFDQSSIPVFNTNSLTLNAPQLDRDFDLTWFAVRKKADDREAVQFERLVGELTAFLPSRFLRVERYGPDARFQPAKDPDELRRRLPEILEALTARGVL